MKSLVKEIKHSPYAYLLVFLYGLYNLQGVLYTSGSIISRLIILIIILAGLFCWIKTYPNLSKNLVVNIISFFVILNILGWITYTGHFGFLVTNTLKGVFVCWLPFFIGIYFTLQKKLNQKFFENAFFFFLLINIISYYRMYNLLTYDFSIYDQDVNVVNNYAYSFVRLVPLLFFVNKNNILKFLLLFVIAYYIVSGAKRGAFVTGTIAIIFYLYFILKGIKKSTSTRVYILILSCIFCYFAYDMFTTNEFLIARFTSNNTSGRDEIYNMIFDAWYSYDLPLKEILFGFGYMSSLDITNSMAHNDWLELLSSFGLLGVCVYLSFFISLFSFTRKNVKDFKEKMVMYSILCVWFTTTLFSSYFNSGANFILMMLIGHLYGTYKLKHLIK